MSFVKRKINVHNTRLFPKHSGANAYRLSGIAARCDWTVMTDGWGEGFSATIRGDLSRQPRTVFLSLRSFFPSLPYFCEEVLPKIEQPFVLVSGSEDVTVPNQLDRRWRRFDKKEKKAIDRLLTDDRVIHWFVENRDEVMPGTSSLPVGYVIEEGQPELIDVPPVEPLVNSRPLRVLCAHRVREGPQWDTRRSVTRLCNTRFKSFATIVKQGLPEIEYRRAVQAHPFVLCVQGGGIDPSPKAWFCLVNGSIPIVQSGPLDDAYSELPVAFVEAWDEACLSPAILQEWIDTLAPHFDNSKMRRQVIEKLALDYWWRKILHQWERHQDREVSAAR